MNGHKEVLSKGMFLRHRLDITNWLNKDGSNYLAVKVHPPDHPGHIPPEGGQGGDHDVRWPVVSVLFSFRLLLDVWPFYQLSAILKTLHECVVCHLNA